MNGCRAKYSSLSAKALVGLVTLASLTAGRSVAAPTAQPSASPALSAIAEGEKPATRPTFADVPPAPSDIRPFVAWRSAIGDIRQVGAQTAAEANAGPWTLSDTQGWADQAKAEANPPPPMTTPAQGDTDAFVREMLRRATPPPRASH
ncbi:MAG TPA: hypothetical protein VKQ70_11380 [Caulobacteraceae bacterium]|jgi:hypothetical protein|nr:hypothetical protein [Caulobacteraceae bacterium]